MREDLAAISGVDTTTRWHADGQLLASDAVFGEPPLIEGAVLTANAVPGAAVQVTARTGIELRVVAGPSAGAVYLLPAGETVVGRDSSADFRLTDPAVSGRHALISWRGLEVVVRDLGSSAGTWLDDQPVGSDPVAMHLGAQLAVGASVLTLADSAGPCAASAADGAGGLVTNRAPRIVQPTPASEIVVAAPPPARQAGGFPWLASIVPLIVSVPLAWRFGTQMLAFTLLPAAAVALTGAGERMSRGKAHRRALADYRRQLAATDTQIAAAIEAEAALRRDEVPDAASLLRIVFGPSLRLWERRSGDHDMLMLRLGVADQDSRITIRRGDPSGPAVPAPRSRSVPVTVSLVRHGVIGLSGHRSAVLGLLRFVIAQVAALHSPRDVRLVVISAGLADDLAWTRWLPHTEPVAEDCGRLLGIGGQQAAARIGELATLIEARAGAGMAPGGSDGLNSVEDSRLVVVVCDGARELRQTAGLSTILADGPGYGVYSICVAPTEAELPTECAATMVVTDEQTGRVRLTESGRGTSAVAHGELVPAAWANGFAKAMAPLRDLTPTAARLPGSVRLLEVLGLEPPDPVAIAERWQAAPRSTVIALGAGSDGPVAVDLAVDGPHAVVAGTTGSGKSELLEVIVAGLAVANRPDELAIVLIDYKGGATFADCARLPHTVAVVTDLDGPLARRALVSLRAELSRRERVLRAAGVPDIESLRVAGPESAVDRLSRLVIVVDEFAALAEELPDFMTGLVALAQRGRSLGIHLILATQRPAGVVSAEIRSNTNLRIAMRMTDPADSQDVIDSPVAARIARQRPGRGYLRVGAGTPIAFQAAQITHPRSAGSGSTVTMEPWQTLGDPVPRPDRCNPGRGPSDLRQLAAAVEAAAAASGLGRPASPWLPPLPHRLTIDQLAGYTRSDPSRDRVPVGLCDLPSSQEQRPLWFDLAAGKHWLVIGGAGTGKSTALRSIASAVAADRPMADAHVYALDCAGGALAGLTALPHTGAVVGADQVDRGTRLLMRLDREVSRRRSELGANGFASLAEHRGSGGHEPLGLAWLVLLIDGWEAFLRTYQELDYGRPVETCYRLLADGPSVGLTIVASGDRSTLTGRLGSLIANRLVLALNDPADYSLAGLVAPDSDQEWPPGRGLLGTESIETQVALICDDPSGQAQQRALEHLAAGLNAAAGAAPVAGAVPFRVPELPTATSLDELRPRLAALAPPDGFWLPVGVGGEELMPVGVPLEAGQSMLVAGPPGSGRTSTLAMAAHWYLSRGISVALAGARPRLGSPVEMVGSGSSRMIGPFGPEDGAEMLSEIAALGSRPLAILVDDADELLDSPLEAAVLSCPLGSAVRIVSGCSESMTTLYRGLVPQVRRSRCGLLLGRYHAADGELLGARIGASINPGPGRGVLVRHGAVIPVQAALP